MQTQTASGAMRAARWIRRLLYPLAVLSAWPTFALADDALATPVTTTYRIVQLSDERSSFGVDINAKGQVAFTEAIGDDVRAKFYDGHIVRDLGTLGGPASTTAAVNDRGQVVGYSRISAQSSVNHAFRWSEGRGMVDLHGPGQDQSDSSAADINNKGQVVGTGAFPFRWSPRTGMQELVTLGAGGGANAINEAGTVVGFAGDPGGEPQGLPARWTRPDRIRVLSNLGSRTSGGRDINAAGQIVGNVPFPPEPFGAEHAFLWTPQRGLIDLGTGSGNFSTASKINDRGMVIGVLSRLPDFIRGFVWTRHAGLIEIGGADVTSSRANDLNNCGQVVGNIDGTAYVWTRAGGVVDLNTRVPDAPRGLLLSDAVAISDNGSIVVQANTGLLLLVPLAASNLSD
jgi:probable HAF family extracellular repeat protein